MSETIELTQSEWNVYSFLLAASERGEVPTYTEIGIACGIRSNSHISKIVCNLRQHGLVRCRGFQRRALTVIRASVAMRPRVDRREAVQP